MNVALFFTYDVSLSEWDRLKIIDREMKFYTDITKDDSDISFTLVTYGSTWKVVMDAVEKLQRAHISCEVIDIQTLVPFDLSNDIERL